MIKYVRTVKVTIMPKLTVLVATSEKQTKNCVGRTLPQIDFSPTSVITDERSL